MKNPTLALILCLTAHVAFGAVPTSWESRGVGGGGAFYSPSLHPTNSREFYVSSDMSGVYRTTDFGDSYTMVPFRRLQGGTESALRFTRDASIAYSLSYASDWVRPVKTTDGGATWTVLAGNPLPDDSAYGIWVDYNNPSRVVVAGYSEIFFSSNGGATFRKLPNIPETSDGVLVGGAFFDGDNVFLGTSIGLLISTNGGTSFSNAELPGIPEEEQLLSFAGAKTGTRTRFFCVTVAQGEAYPGKNIAADYYQAVKGIYTLENGTGNWARRMSGIDPSRDFVMFVAMAANDINTVYAGGSRETSSGAVPLIMKTVDGGQQWTSVFRTDNNQNISTGWSGRGGDRDWSYGEVVLGLAVAPSDSNRVVFTDLGFVHRTSDGGTTWQQAYVNPADQHRAGATTPPRRSYRSIGLENTSTWQVVWSDARNLFAAFSDIRGLRSTDGGLTWSFNYTGHTANTMYRLVKHPSRNVLYAATSGIHDLYQSTRLADNPLDNADAGGKILSSNDQGASWQELHTFGHPVFWLALDPTNPNRMYASVVHSSEGGVYTSSNIQDGSGSAWIRLPRPPRTEGHPASLVVLNDGKLLCSYSGRRAPGFTASSGVFLYDPATGAWSDVSAPGLLYWTKDVVVDPTDSAQNTWYAGVFSGWGGAPNGLGGLYRTTDRGARWTRINALDRVTSVTFNPLDGHEAFLTTETEGLWHTENIHAGSPVFTRVESYPFRQPERVFYNPHDPSEIWVTSFGGGLRVGKVDNTPTAPVISTQPRSVTVAPGQSASLTVAATGSGLTYQWFRNGSALVGATAATLTINSVQASDAGTYYVVVTGPGGSTQSNSVTLTVGTPSPGNARLTNLSTRGYVGTGHGVMIAGFIVRGTGTKTVLIRAGGPALAKQGVGGTLQDPVLRVYSGDQVIASNDDWTAEPDKKAEIVAATSAAGALAWDDGSKDAIVVLNLPEGGYTAMVSGKNDTTGTALVEIWDAEKENTNARLWNISTRSPVLTGLNVQIAGFILTGSGARNVVIRTSGPSLARYGVQGPLLADPTLVLRDAQRPLSSNDNWDVALKPTFQSLGVDNWDTGSTEAALTAQLTEGGYTAMVSGKNDTTGIALVEVFEGNDP